MTPRTQPTWTTTTQGPEETMALGEKCAALVSDGDVIALDGDLGAGKTQLVRGLARGMAVANRGSVASPTFVLMHEYQPSKPGGLVLVHIDAYRLHSADDLESMGFPGSAVDPLGELRRGAVVVVEWARKVEPILGENVLWVEITHQGPTTRRITLTGRGDWADRVRSMGTPAPSTRCPICKAGVETASQFFPFCSSRCKRVDLGRWLGGSYKISRPIDQSDLEET